MLDSIDDMVVVLAFFDSALKGYEEFESGWANVVYLYDLPPAQLVTATFDGLVAEECEMGWSNVPYAREWADVTAGCERCGFERLVAFSCKRRGFWPSCLGRRMSDTAVHLVEKVIPEVPVRQWVCSLPWRLRVLLGYDRRLCADVLEALVVELRRALRRRAKKALELPARTRAHNGAVSVVQRGDSALRLNVHLNRVSG